MKNGKFVLAATMLSFVSSSAMAGYCRVNVPTHCEIVRTDLDKITPGWEMDTSTDFTIEVDCRFSGGRLATLTTHGEIPNGFFESSAAGVLPAKVDYRKRSDRREVIDATCR